MKMKLLAALIMLLAFGCAQEPGSTSTSSSTPETETQLTSTKTVSFDVTGMT